MSLIPAFGRERQKNLSEFEASMFFKVTSSTNQDYIVIPCPCYLPPNFLVSNAYTMQTQSGWLTEGVETAAPQIYVFLI